MSLSTVTTAMSRSARMSSAVSASGAPDTTNPSASIQRDNTARAAYSSSTTNTSPGAADDRPDGFEAVIIGILRASLGDFSPQRDIDRSPSIGTFTSEVTMALKDMYAYAVEKAQGKFH